MNELRIRLVRSPHISPAERQQRLAQAYDLLLSLGKQPATMANVEHEVGECLHQNGDTAAHEHEVQMTEDVAT